MPRRPNSRCAVDRRATAPPVGEASQAERPAIVSPSGPTDAERGSSRGYRSLLVRGAAAALLGILLLFSGATLSRLTTFVAAYWILAALLTMRWARANPFEAHHRLTLAAGVAALAAGLAVVLRPLYSSALSVTAFLDLLGATAMAMGLLRIAGWIHDDQIGGHRTRRRYRFVLGTLEVLLGVALVLATEGASDQVRVALGLWGILTGSFLLLDAYTLRGRGRSQRKQPS